MITSAILFSQIMHNMNIIHNLIVLLIRLKIRLLDLKFIVLGVLLVHS